MKSAERIKQLETALKKIADLAPGYGDVCEQIARIAWRALRGEGPEVAGLTRKGRRYARGSDKPGPKSAT